jgi:hypothetical protein
MKALQDDANNYHVVRNGREDLTVTVDELMYNKTLSDGVSFCNQNGCLSGHDVAVRLQDSYFSALEVTVSQLTVHNMLPQTMSWRNQSDTLTHGYHRDIWITRSMLDMFERALSYGRDGGATNDLALDTSYLFYSFELSLVDQPPLTITVQQLSALRVLVCAYELLHQPSQTIHSYRRFVSSLVNLIYLL